MDLSKEAETLTAFRNRVEEALSKLERSSASAKAMGDHRIAGDAYGKGFDSAEALAALYETVHGRLQELSKVFGDQIEAMGLAAVIAERGYDGMDAEEAARMRGIEERALEYRRSRPAASDSGQPGAASAAPPSEGGTGATGGGY
ncbi:hypothetical protein ACFP1Z_33180 [Streptomyces gamaensis]|uniref:Uncharacterized protein n=1 Tax=Streptomyces gamaensis TaxID=1763542 RepID=A0ABW0Z8H7_9ACTN